MPSLEAGYTSPSGEYHSAYDDTYQLEHFLDPGYVHEAAAAKILGVAALRLANADVYPLRYSDYATAVQGYVDDLAAGRAAARRRAGRPGAAASGRAGLGRGDERAGGARGPAAGATPGRHDRGDRALSEINATLMRQERWLITPVGLPGRPWFRHQIYAPGINSGYATQELPGMRDAVEQGDVATATRYRDLLVASLQRAAADARSASPRGVGVLR